MEQEEPQGALYDFLYRDSGRITSYYAQLFGGRLTGLEETDTSRDAVDKSGRLNTGVVSGDLKTIQEDTTSSKRITDPHDIITTDVLSHLQENGRLQTNIKDAPHGAIIIAKGTIVFVDKSVLEIADLVFEMEIEVTRKTARTTQEKARLNELKFIRSFLSKIALPSGFLLQTAEGVQIAGTIKESGMEETISSYYFKHGSAGLSDVFLIGIKESSTYSFTLPNTQLIGAGQMAVQGLTTLMFPPEAIRVTPVALFRPI